MKKLLIIALLLTILIFSSVSVAALTRETDGSYRNSNIGPRKRPRFNFETIFLFII